MHKRDLRHNSLRGINQVNIITIKQKWVKCKFCGKKTTSLNRICDDCVFECEQAACTMSRDIARKLRVVMQRQAFVK
jgi:predicted amidophosphoribosyltransferase